MKLFSGPITSLGLNSSWKQVPRQAAEGAKSGNVTIYSWKSQPECKQSKQQQASHLRIVHVSCCCLSPFDAFLQILDFVVEDRDIRVICKLQKHRWARLLASWNDLIPLFSHSLQFLKESLQITKQKHSENYILVKSALTLVMLASLNRPVTCVRFHRFMTERFFRTSKKSAKFHAEPGNWTYVLISYF